MVLTLSLPASKKMFMKNKLLYSLFCAALFITSCSEKFDVAAPYKNITVVSGVLDASDTAHYIRIQKAFLDQNKSAIDMAKVADSNFYANLTVKVYATNMNSGNLVGTPITLTKVDMNNEGYPKAPGTFFTAPNYAYKFKTALDPQYRYVLTITNNATGEIDSASTTIVNTSGNNLAVPSIFNVVNPSLSPDTSADNTTPFKVTIPSDTMVVQAYLRLHWVDKNVGTGVQTDQYADWNFDNENHLGGSQYLDLQANNNALFKFLRNAMGPAPQGVERYIDSSDLIIYGGSADFYTYSVYYGVPGTGLTGSDIQPIYTNIKGKNVLGLFASRGERIRKSIGFSNFTIGLMKNSGILNDQPFSCNVKGISDH